MRDEICLSLFFEENSRGRCAELVTSVEAGNFEDEEVTDDFALELVNEFGSGLCGTT